MDFQGPEATDLANVHALNLGFLKLLRSHEAVLAATNPAAGGVLSKLGALSSTRADRIAQCPFLVYSLAD